MLENWLAWSTGQLQDMSMKLARQGYDQNRIDFLLRTDAVFRARYQTFMTQFESVCDAMAEDPEAYSHYDTLLQAKNTFLLFTNEHRGVLLPVALAETA